MDSNQPVQVEVPGKWVSDSKSGLTREGPPKIRETLFNDYAQIAALHKRNGLSVKSRQDWIALWKGNPAYEYRKGDWPIGWVLETPGGRIVGSIGNLPISYWFRGQRMRAASPCAWAVDLPYRGYSILALACVMTQKNLDMIVCTSVSLASEPSFSAFQCVRVPAGSWDKAAFWITNYRGFCQSALIQKAVPLPGMLSYPTSAALFCRDIFRDRGLQIGASSAKVEINAGFDGRFDQFWDELKDQNYNKMLPERTRETLAWHFRAKLAGNDAWIVTATDRGRLVAYAIFDRQDNAALQLKRVRLIDFQALEGHGKVIGPVLDCMLRKCKTGGAHILEYSGNWLDRPDMPPVFAPYRRNLSNWMYYYRAANKQLREALKDPGAWAPSSFDGDASL